MTEKQLERVQKLNRFKRDDAFAAVLQNDLGYYFFFYYVKPALNGSNKMKRVWDEVSTSLRWAQMAGSRSGEDNTP